MARPLAMATRGKQTFKREHIIYLAGVVDSDGSISISKNLPATIKNAPTLKNPRYVLHLAVVNTSKDLMEWLVSTFGGVYRPRKMQRPDKQRVTYDWRFNNGKALPLLEALKPYLIVKKERAQVGIDLLRGWTTTVGGMGAQTTPEEVARRDELWALMKEMNRQGVVQPQRLSPLTPASQ
ncbi:MAG: hypothetical protein ACM3SS_11525 [Rhodospirillaceae bacterium]